MLRNQRILAALIGFLFFSSLYFSCKSKSEINREEPVKNEKKTVSENSALAWYDLEDENPQVVKLPGELNEISGIAITDDGRLFCEVDEDADIFELDYKSGTVTKKFYAGTSIMGSKTGDFEDIAWVKNKFYLLDSKGRLLEFPEGAEGEHVPFKIYETKLNKSNDVEGLCYDPETNSLLLACKRDPGEGYEKLKAVYSFSLSTMTLADTPRFLVPLDKIKSNTLENEFSPSGIARHPVTGTFFIIAARGNVVIELSKTGELLNEKDLPKKVHKQPEGIAFDKENNLIISNEGKDKSPTIVIYPMKKQK
jgi:uncharacterized protein YjiK